MKHLICFIVPFRAICLKLHGGDTLYEVIGNVYESSRQKDTFPDTTVWKACAVNREAKCVFRIDSNHSRHMTRSLADVNPKPMYIGFSWPRPFLVTEIWEFDFWCFCQ